MTAGAIELPARPSAFRDCADLLQCPVTGEPLAPVEWGWISAGGVDFLSSIPAADGNPFTQATRQFEPHPRGAATVRAATQLQMLLTGGRDGGLFIMIGRKRP
jgi:hypothetical protein